MTKSWKTIRIGDWGEVKGGRQRSPHLTAGRMRPYLRVANVFDGFIDTSDVLSMPFTDAEFQQYAVMPGDVLLNEGQSIELVGRSAVYEGPASEYAFQNTLVRFRPGPECDPLYAHEVFRQLWRQGVFQSIAKKTTSIAHLGVARFAELRVRVPSIDGQRQVAGLLRCFNAALTKLSELVAAKQVLKRGLMSELLTARRRFPGFRNASWAEALLGELFAERNETGYPSLRLLSVTADRGVIPREQVDRKDTSNADKSKYQRVSKGDIAYNTMRMWQGVSALSEYEGIVSPAYTVLVPRGPMSECYARHLFKLPRMVHTFWRRSQGLVDDTLSLKYPGLARIPVRYPGSLAEQSRIADVLDSLDQELALLERMRAGYEDEKSVLMHRLLSGDVTLPESVMSEPESANV